MRVITIVVWKDSSKPWNKPETPDANKCRKEKKCQHRNTVIVRSLIPFNLFFFLHLISQQNPLLRPQVQFCLH